VDIDKKCSQLNHALELSLTTKEVISYDRQQDCHQSWKRGQQDCYQSWKTERC
jgi:hypothetical protein